MKSPTRSSRPRRNAAGAELAAALLAFAVLPLAAEETAAAPAHADTVPAHSATAAVNEVDGLFQKALAARKAGKTDEALDCLEKATELAPDRTDVLFELLRWPASSPARAARFPTRSKPRAPSNACSNSPPRTPVPASG